MAPTLRATTALVPPDHRMLPAELYVFSPEWLIPGSGVDNRGGDLHVFGGKDNLRPVIS